MMFGKPGRPPEDRVARQREIYLAAVPLLKRDGARRLSMREVACAACMSIGGLYYYFPTKRALVLYGLRPEAAERFCLDVAEEYERLIATDLGAYRRFLLEHVYRVAADFALPAYDAAVELGLETRLDEVHGTLEHLVEGLVDHLKPLLPQLDETRLEAMSTAVHRLMLGAFLDRSATPEQMCRDLDALITGYGAAPAGASPPEVVENGLVEAPRTV